MDNEKEKLAEVIPHPDRTVTVTQTPSGETAELTAHTGEGPAAQREKHAGYPENTKGDEPDAEKEMRQREEAEVISAPADDYADQVAELIAARPEVRTQSVPDEVFRKCIRTGRRILSVYDDYLIASLREENTKLKSENETLRHNAENALRAPVTASAASVTETNEDPFLIGLRK